MDLGTAIRLILELGLFGFIIWLIVTYIPMPAPIKTVIYVVAAIVMILFCLNLFGAFDASTHQRLFR
jgi:hypothetical protein